MKIYLIRNPAGLYLDWTPADLPRKESEAGQWVTTRADASRYLDRETAEGLSENLTANYNLPCAVEEIDFEAGQKALKVLATLYEIRDLGDFIYTVRDSEGLGWEGPRVTQWNDACQLAEELIKATKHDTCGLHDS